LLYVYHAPPIADYAAAYWHSKTRPPYNIGAYQSARVDRLLDVTAKRHDSSEKMAIFHQIHAIIDQDKAALFLYYPYQFSAASKYVGVPDSLFSNWLMPFHLFKDVFLTYSKIKKGGD